MKVRLIERTSGTEPKPELVVHQEDFLIGRGPDCDLRLNETTISRHHCIIRPGTDEPTLIDLGSANGTFLNGHRILSTAVLHSGDDLLLGSSCRFVVVLGEEDWFEPGLEPTGDPMATTFRLRKPQKPS